MTGPYWAVQCYPDLAWPNWGGLGVGVLSWMGLLGVILDWAKLGCTGSNYAGLGGGVCRADPRQPRGCAPCAWCCTIPPPTPHGWLKSGRAPGPGLPWGVGGHLGVGEQCPPHQNKSPSNALGTSRPIIKVPATACTIPDPPTIIQVPAMVCIGFPKPPTMIKDPVTAWIGPQKCQDTCGGASPQALGLLPGQGVTVVGWSRAGWEQSGVMRGQKEVGTPGRPPRCWEARGRLHVGSRESGLEPETRSNPTLGRGCLRPTRMGATPPWAGGTEAKTRGGDRGQRPPASPPLLPLPPPRSEPQFPPQTRLPQGRRGLPAPPPAPLLTGVNRCRH